MKSIKEFKSFELNTKNIFGGKCYQTNEGSCGDTWDDKDDSGTLSPGDTICYETCPEEELPA